MNEIALSDDLNLIEEEIEFHSHRTKKSLWEIGRRLKHVKDNDLTHGQFMDWYQSIGLNKNFVSRAITIAEEFTNFPALGNVSDTALYLIATLPEEDREKEHVTSKGEKKTVDQMTTRELSELKKQLKEKDNQLAQAKRSEQLAIEQLEREQNKEPKVITETIEKEVVPDDYEDLKRMNQSLKNEIEFANKKYSMLEASTRSAKELEQKIRSLEDREQSVTQRIEAIERLNHLEEEFEEFFDTKVAPMRFKPITEELYGTNATQRIRQLVETARHWVKEMDNILPQRDIQYAEIIEEE